MAYDLAVGVVNGAPADLGNKLGWFPTAAWHKNWAEPRALFHIGYPHGGSIPLAAGGGSALLTLERTTMGISGTMIGHDVDATVGQSGGPIFVWGKLSDPNPLPDQPCLPLVVGVQSAEIGALNMNAASGGALLPLLVWYAVNVFP
jgi:hypothetical protein